MALRKNNFGISKQVLRSGSYTEGVKFQSPGSRSAPWVPVTIENETPTGFHN
jgi:hypothetical protein